MWPSIWVTLRLMNCWNINIYSWILMEMMLMVDITTWMTPMIETLGFDDRYYRSSNQKKKKIRNENRGPWPFLLGKTGKMITTSTCRVFQKECRTLLISVVDSPALRQTNFGKIKPIQTTLQIFCSLMCRVMPVTRLLDQLSYVCRRHWTWQCHVQRSIEPRIGGPFPNEKLFAS